MDKPENVRLADKADIESIFWPCMRSYAEDNDLGIPVSPMAVFRMIEALCTGQGGIAGVIDGPNGVVASIGIRAVPFWFGYDEQPFLTEIWCFVSKAHKTEGRFLQDLFNFAEWHRQDMSERLGYDMVLENAVMSLSRLPALSRIWEGFYGPPVGAVFWGRGEEHVLREQQQQNSNVRTDKPSGPVGLRQPSAASPTVSEPAPQHLQRPTRRTTEPEPEHGDSGHSQRPGNRTALFD